MSAYDHIHLDKYSELDFVRMRDEIETSYGSSIFDRDSFDIARMVDQIEAATGIEISNAALLDPQQLIVELKAIFGSDEV